MSTSAAANGNGADTPVDTENWVNIQKKTFTKWCNNHLSKKGYPLIENSQTDFETGVMLMNLIHALYPHVHIPKYNHHPKLRPHKLDNIVLALKMVEEAKIKTNFLKSTHLIDHDLKMILGMQWAIILDYAIKGINVEELTAKEGLLLWVRRKTAGYRDVDPPGVQNFTKDFRNGLVLCALIHRHRPDLLNYDSLSKENAAENIELAFSIAEKDLGIPRLLDVEDLTTEKPDERSVITYVSEYFHKFSAGALKEQAARRTARFIKFQRNIYQMRHNYERLAKELLQWTIRQTSEFSDAKFPELLEEIIQINGEFKQFVLTIKPPKAAQKLDCEALFAEIQSQLKVNNRPPYIPPQEISPDALEEAWNNLWTTEQIYARQARDQRFKFIKKQEYKVDETKIQEFTEAFNHFDSNNDNELDKTEFKAALSANGVDFKEDAFVKLFDAIREGNNGISLHQYIHFLVEREQDKDTPEQLNDSFKTLADDQPYITANQLANSGLPADDVQFLSETMATNDNGQLDYVHYVEESFVHY